MGRTTAPTNLKMKEGIDIVSKQTKDINHDEHQKMDNDFDCGRMEFGWAGRHQPSEKTVKYTDDPKRFRPIRLSQNRGSHQSCHEDPP